MNKEEDKKQDKVEIGKKMRLDDKGGDEKEMKKERKKREYKARIHCTT